MKCPFLLVLLGLFVFAAPVQAADDQLPPSPLPKGAVARLGQPARVDRRRVLSETAGFTGWQLALLWRQLVPPGRRHEAPPPCSFLRRRR